MSLSDENSKLLVDSAHSGLKFENVQNSGYTIPKLFSSLSTSQELEDKEFEKFSNWR
jgi:hypothetical protein